MAPRLSGQNCKFLKLLLSFNSQKRLRYKENNTKYRSFRVFVLAQAKNLRGTTFAVARDFPKEIVEKRKILVPILKDAKKSGHANLVYDKLYINGQLYSP